jgi:Flp pilus assembly protein TadB
MSASPARRLPYQPPAPEPEQRSPTAQQRRRQQRLLARRRRDLLEDVVAAIVLTIVAITLTAGLGVIALIEVPVVLALVISYVRDRRRRRAALSRRGRRGRRAPD